MEEKILGREKCDTQTAHYKYFYKKDRKQMQARLPEEPEQGRKCWRDQAPCTRSCESAQGIEKKVIFPL